MKKLGTALTFLAALWTSLAAAQTPPFPNNMPPNTVYGRLGISSGPGQAIPFGQLFPLSFNTQPAALNAHSVILSEGATNPLTAVAPGSATLPFVSNGPGVDPSYQLLVGNGIASATITGSNVAASTLTNSNLVNMLPNSVKANPTGSSAAPIDWQIGASNNVNGSGLPGTSGQQLYIFRAPSAVETIQSTFRVDRSATYTGGTPGNVFNAIFGYMNPSAGVADFQWAILGVVDNNATAGENVGGFFQGNKLTTSTAATWGATAQVREETGAANPTSASVGIELDVMANGTDSNATRVIADLVGQKFGSGTAPTITWGWRVGAQNGVAANASFTHGGQFVASTYTDLISSNATVTTTNGIDFSLGTFTGSPFKSSGFNVDASGNVNLAVGNAIKLNGSILAVNGVISTGTSTVTCCGALKPGLAGAGTPTEWLEVVNNGNTFWIPMWPN